MKLLCEFKQGISPRQLEILNYGFSSSVKSPTQTSFGVSYSHREMDWSPLKNGNGVGDIIHDASAK